MAIQIETPETIRHVEEVSRLTGENPEEVVTAAVANNSSAYAPLNPESHVKMSYKRLSTVMAARFEEPYRSIDPGEWLYGEDGLPR